MRLHDLMHGEHSQEWTAAMRFVAAIDLFESTLGQVITNVLRWQSVERAWAVMAGPEAFAQMLTMMQPPVKSLRIACIGLTGIDPTTNGKSEASVEQIAANIKAPSLQAFIEAKDALIEMLLAQRQQSFPKGGQ